MAMPEQCNKIPRWLVVAVLLSSVGRFTCDGWASVSQNKSVSRIAWKSFEETIESKVAPSKPVLLFTTHGDDCASCQRAERRLQDETNARNIAEKFVPVKLIDTRGTSEKSNEDVVGKQFLDRRTGIDVPCLSIVMPDGWNVDHGTVIADYNLYFSYPGDLKEFLTRDKRQSLPISFDEHGGGYIFWERDKAKALAEMSAKKPLFVYFNQVNDLHCLRTKGPLLTESRVRRIANSKCTPILVTSVSRLNKPDSDIDRELLKRCRVTGFPSVGIIYKDRDPLVYRGSDAKALANFLGAATGESSDYEEAELPEKTSK